jgi:tRNA (uracil-5-)-methyltransferase TRM9
MDLETVRRLIELNLQFYQTFAHSFSATRRRLQPGVRRIVEQLPHEVNILDLGCGNGELSRILTRSGRRGAYVGLDFSPELIEIAVNQGKLSTQESDVNKSKDFHVTFLHADLSSPNWPEKIPKLPYDFILAFAILHHLPGYALRLETLQQAFRVLKPEGYFIHSEWQFLNSQRLRARIVPWEKIGLSEHQVDTGDYLLDWRQGGYGMRYAHHFSEIELVQFAQDAGFHICQSFLSDGEGGKLGLYQVWKVKGDKIN